MLSSQEFMSSLKDFYIFTLNSCLLVFVFLKLETEPRTERLKEPPNPLTGFGSFTVAKFGTRCPAHAPGISFHTLQPWKSRIPYHVFTRLHSHRFATLLTSKTCVVTPRPANLSYLSQTLFPVHPHLDLCPLPEVTGVQGHLPWQLAVNKLGNHVRFHQGAVGYFLKNGGK